MIARRQKAPARAAARDAGPVPVVLPRVLMSVSADGAMTVTVDGAPVEPPEFAPAWRREDLTRILDRLTSQGHSPLRVEVRETDGSVFTDIVTPSKHRLGPPPRSAPPVPPPPRTATVATGGGFLPGEDVAVAIVVSHTDAGPDGTARAVLTANQLGAGLTREVILFGRVSGTLTIESSR